jgi:hypothetical protein
LIKYFGSFLKKHNPFTLPRLKACVAFVRKSWKSIALLAPALILLYYGIGSFASNHIDKQTDLDYARSERGLTVVDAAASLIRHEVDDHLWTPNLPIIFPGYILDNMPAFQSGIIWSERVLAKTLKHSFDSKDLDKAAELLDYPTNIWLLSKKNNLSLAPSSGAQYRKARQAMLQFNEKQNAPIDDKAFLLSVLKQIQKKFGAIDASLQRQVQEESSGWFDFKADDVFYTNQGRLYGFYVFLKALAQDYKELIVQADQYQAWTSVLKTLEDGLATDPFIVRNGTPDAFLTPNHLIVLDFYTLKAQYGLAQIAAALSKETDDADSH